MPKNDEFYSWLEGRRREERIEAKNIRMEELRAKVRRSIPYGLNRKTYDKVGLGTVYNKSFTFLGFIVTIERVT